jgi:thioredoxin 1
MQQFDDRSWDTEVLGSREPVAVVFWADWCLPSRSATEQMESLSQRAGRFRIGAVNVDENPRTTERYGIR